MNSRDKRKKASKKRIIKEAKRVEQWLKEQKNAAPSAAQ